MPLAKGNAKNHLSKYKKLYVMFIFYQLFIKVLNKEKQTWKTMMVDQTWTVRDVTQKMVSKDDVEIEPNWCILEKLPDLDMG